MWRIRDIHIHVEKPASRVNSFFFFDSNHKIRGSVHSHTTYLLVGSSLFFPSSSSAQLLPLFRWKGGAGPVLLHCDIIPWFWNTEQRWKSSLEELDKPHHTATERLYTCAFQMSWSPTLSHICSEKAGERSLQQSHEVRKLFHKHTFVPPWSILLLKPPGGLRDIDPAVIECVDSSFAQLREQCVLLQLLQLLPVTKICVI